MKEDAENMLKTSQKLSDKAEVNANKVEDIFYELQDKSSKLQKVEEKQTEFDSRLNDSTERLNSIEVSYDGLPSQDKFQDLRDDYQKL